MRMLEVRCCCKPQSHLGWLPWPSKAVDEVIFIGEKNEKIILKRRSYADAHETYFAIESNDTPIEKLKKIKDFIPHPQHSEKQSMRPMNWRAH